VAPGIVAANPLFACTRRPEGRDRVAIGRFATVVVPRGGKLALASLYVRPYIGAARPAAPLMR